MKGVLLTLCCILVVAVNSVAAADASKPTRYLRTLADKQGDELSQAEEDTSVSAAQTNSRGLVDLIHLVPFDVQIAVTVDNGIETHEVANIVTTWMNDAFAAQLTAFGYTEEFRYAEFDTVVLFNNDEPSNRRRRRLQSGGELFTARFRGGAVFSRDETRNKSIPENDVLLIQQATLLNDTSLAERLQSSSALGLGSAVVDVNAFLNPVSSTASTSGTDATNTQGSGLAIVIVVAIGVACVAFLFLLGAVIWAYRFDSSNREAYLVKERSLVHGGGGGGAGSPDRTDSDTAYDNDSPERIRAVHVERSTHAYPTMIGGDDGDNGYPESVISDSIVSGSVMSEDISTSLSQYYRAGMGKTSGSSDYGRGGGLLSDAGSVSSMESYGYSLDGGMSAVVPTDGPYKKERERIGGLPVEPDDMADNYETNMEDVQIPDLDQELANLDIKLLPNMEHIDVETYSQQDLEEYQMQDLEEMEALSQRSPMPMDEPSACGSSLTNPLGLDNLNDVTADDGAKDDVCDEVPRIATQTSL